MQKLIAYAGLDVEKETIAVALADAGKRGEVREHEMVANTPTALNTFQSICLALQADSSVFIIGPRHLIPGPKHLTHAPVFRLIERPVLPKVDAAARPKHTRLAFLPSVCAFRKVA